MEIEELNHVTLYVKDLAKSQYFYQELLGLEIIPRPAFSFPGLWFRLGKQQELHLIGNCQELLTFYKQQHFALRVKSALKTEELLKSKGVFYRGPKKRADGASQLFIQDPDGYFIEFFEE